MPTTIVSPMNDAAASPGIAAPRLAALTGATIALLDITKPGGRVFLDRLDDLLRRRFGVAGIVRVEKATYTKPARPEILEALRGADAVVEALAD
ncbi:MAG: hypothetical protein R2745_12560 [Vicinamibacterales bacterium]